MKYMMLIAQSQDPASLPPAVYEETHKAIMSWWQAHAEAGRIVGGHQLQPARTATTVRWNGGHALVTDGPFIEAKETVGGYGILDVPDLDAAIAIAKSWPGKQHVLEIRPIVERG